MIDPVKLVCSACRCETEKGDVRHSPCNAPLIVVDADGYEVRSVPAKWQTVVGKRVVRIPTHWERVA